MKLRHGAALLMAGGLLLLVGAAADRSDEPDLGGRVARLEREIREARDRRDLQRIGELLPEAKRLETDLAAAIKQWRPGYPPKHELQELLNMVRHLHAEGSRLTTWRNWRKMPLPKIDLPPDPRRITIRPDADGMATITGSPGAARDKRSRLVRAVNLMTTDQGVAIVRTDGSFRVKLMAPPGSSVQISTALADELPEPVRRQFELGRTLHLDGPLRHVREILDGNRTTSPGLILPVRVPGGKKGTTGFVSRLGREAWAFGTAELRRSRFKPGQAGEVRVALTMRFPSAEVARRAVRHRPTIDPILSPLFDARGRHRAGGRLLATHVLTPTGLPIESHADMAVHHDDRGRRHLAPGGPGIGLPYEPVDRGGWQLRGRVATITQRLRFEIPRRVPAGVYALRAVIWPGAGEVLLEGAPEGEACLGRVTIGQPARPRLACMLLGSAGTGGSRGAIAREDRGDYNVSPHNVFLPEKLVIPRDNVRTGKPHWYPLDPYLPLVALTDRPGEMRIWPPRIRFDCAGSRLTVTVSRPDGRTDRLGPAPLVAGQNDLSSAGPDRIVFDRLVAPWGRAYGNPSLADIYHLSGGEAFMYTFKQYGHHVIALSGHVKDLTGTPHVIRGTYDVYVARPVDINVFPEPGTPLQPGRAIRPQVRVLPAMGADVEIVFRQLPGSVASKAVVRRITGRANRWGIFVPPATTKPVIFDEPGEYVCDVTAKYVDARGVWWMACRRGASVVATPNSKVIVHGERGNRAPTQRWRARWFIARESRFITGTPPGAHDMGHTCYPYEPGDVAWLGHRDPDSLFPNVTLEDPTGVIADLIEGRWPDVRQGAGRAGLYPDWLKPEDRRAIGELPLVCSSMSGLSPSMAPQRVDQWGYFYTTSWRPGVSVRSHVGEDMVPASYWFFDDPYGYQFGVGPHGDLPGDFKMNYAGTVFRDSSSTVKHYGAYASMVVLIDADKDPIGRRVLPPFDGLLPGSPRSGPLLTIGGKRYDVFLTFGAVSPGAVLTVGDRLSISGVVWPPVSGLVRGSVAGPSGRKIAFEIPSDAMGVFDLAGPVVNQPGAWRILAEGVCNGRTSAGRIADLIPADKWPRGGGIGLEANTFVVPVVPARAEPIAFDLPPGTRAAPPKPLVIHGHLPAGTDARTVHVVVALPNGVIDQGELPVAGRAFTYVYDPKLLAKQFPNIDVTLPSPDPIHHHPAWYDTVTFTFWAGKGPGLRAGTVLLQGEDVYAMATTGRPAPKQASAPAMRRPTRKVAPKSPARHRRPASVAKDFRAPRSSLLALSRDARTLFAAHPWSGEVIRLRLGKGSPKVEATAKLGGHVRSIAPAPDGSRVYAALSDTRQIVALDAATLKERSRWTLVAEPWAVLSSADGRGLFIADYDGSRILRISAATGKVEAASPKISRPSCLALAPKGDELYTTSFRTGEVVVLDARCRILRRLPACKQLNQCRTATLGPDGVLYAPQMRSDTTVGGRMFDRTVFPAIAVARPGDKRVSIGIFPDLLTVPPHRPREAAVDAATLYLVSSGSDDVVAIDLATTFPKWHARKVGLEPGGIVLDRRRRRLYVLTVTGQEIVSIAARDGKLLSRVRVAHDPTPPTIARGRYLFGTATDKRLTKDQWISCAACHPDGGGQDGRQWDLGQGPLDTRSLRGSMAATPLHYTAHLDEIQDTYHFTRMTMGGQWFIERWRLNDYLVGKSNAGLNRDLDALSAYIEGLTPKRPPPAPAELMPVIRRGKAIFESDKTGCTTCHPAPRYTDSGQRDTRGNYIRHDVGTWSKGRAASLRTLDTPSLLGLRQSEPYLHDGRAATLEEAFTRFNPKDRHGRTSHLRQEDISALATFLRYLDPGPKKSAPRKVRPIVPENEYNRDDVKRTRPLVSVLTLGSTLISAAGSTHDPTRRR